MDPRLLELLVCPICKGKLRHDRAHQELICRADRLAYPIRDDIPLLLQSAARELTTPDTPSDAATPTSP